MKNETEILRRINAIQSITTMLLQERVKLVQQQEMLHWILNDLGEGLIQVGANADVIEWLITGEEKEEWQRYMK
mgnify:FL=1